MLKHSTIVAICLATLGCKGTQTASNVGANDPAPTVEPSINVVVSPETQPTTQPVAQTQPDSPYTFRWSSIGINSQIDLWEGKITTSVTLSGVVAIPPNIDAIGYYPQIEFTKAVFADAKGNELTTGASKVDTIRAAMGAALAYNPNRSRYFNSLRNAGSMPNVNGQMNWSGPRPEMVKRLEGSVTVVIASKAANVDVLMTPAKTDKPVVDLGSGLTAWAEAEPRKNGSQLIFTMNASRAGGSGPIWAGYGGNNLRAPFIRQITLIDKDGRPVGGGNVNINTNGSENSMQFQLYVYDNGNGPLDPKKVAGFRVDVVTNCDEIQAPFVMRDIPLP